MSEAIRRKLASLERRIVTKPVRLIMPDGATHEIVGGFGHWNELRDCAEKHGAVPVSNIGSARELAWLRDAAKIEEPSGQLFTLLAVILRGGVRRVEPTCLTTKDKGEPNV